MGRRIAGSHAGLLSDLSHNPTGAVVYRRFWSSCWPWCVHLSAQKRDTAASQTAVLLLKCAAAGLLSPPCRVCCLAHCCGRCRHCCCCRRLLHICVHTSCQPPSTSLSHAPLNRIVPLPCSAPAYVLPLYVTFMFAAPGCSMPASIRSNRLGPLLLPPPPPPVLALPAGLVRSPDWLLLLGLTDTLCVHKRTKL